jgi:uncharacterized iron-regulated protein
LKAGGKPSPRRAARAAGLLARWWVVPWLLGACALSPAQRAPALPLSTLPTQGVLLLGEQHDNPHHQHLQQQAVQHLLRRGTLNALALEMAPAGASTQGLPAHATDEAIQRALRWSQAGWPWAPYAATIRLAVRAQVPVVGANLPRAAIMATMQDPSIDTSVPPQVWQQQRQAVAQGHCGLLPESQLDPMTRVQVARDQRMARTLAALWRPGQVTVLLTGSAHANRTLGVPLHVPAQVPVTSVYMAPQGAASSGFDVTWPAPAAPARDYCAELKRQGMPKRPAAS